MLPRKAFASRGSAAALGALLALLAVVALPAPAAQASGPLRQHAADRDILIGTALATGPLAGEAPYRDTANREFNAVTAENAMKWDATEPSRNQFNFTGADQIMASAQANGQTVHGHALVWHSQTPSWVQSLSATEMRAAMQHHINTVVGRYAGRIASWDVVNEVFNEDGTLRQSFWLNTLGQSYIADAFRFARAADPGARLCINDFNVEGQNAKSNAMFNLVSQLRGQGVPIDCVGLQGHLAIQFGFPSDIQQNIQRFANLGVDVKITELDVRMQLPVDATKLATQATFYQRVVNACLAVSRCTGVTIWGFTDRHSWVPSTFPGEGAALPFDENYTAKPAYTAVHDALAGGSGPPDTTPPSTPGTPVASNVTSGSVTLSWAASTDNVGVTGYEVFRATGASGGSFTLVGSSVTASFTNTGLSGATTYRYSVRARDAVPNFSANSGIVSVTTPPGGGTGTCRIGYSASSWGGSNGFTGSVTITNTGASAVNGWTLAFSFTAGQRVSLPGWSAVWAQPAGSANVTATNLDWNRTLGPNGGSTTIGFNGTHTGTNPAPTAFTLNGTACTTS